MPIEIVSFVLAISGTLSILFFIFFTISSTVAEEKTCMNATLIFFPITVVLLLWIVFAMPSRNDLEKIYVPIVETENYYIFEDNEGNIHNANAEFSRKSFDTETTQVLIYNRKICHGGIRWNASPLFELHVKEKVE